MYWIYTLGVREIVILAVGDLTFIIVAGISLFFGLFSIDQFFQYKFFFLYFLAVMALS